MGDVVALVDRLAAVITVTGGRRAGDPETRIHLDHLVPVAGRASVRPCSLAAGFDQCPAVSAARRPRCTRRVARRTVSKAVGLLATDLANDHQVAALLSWHFESSGRRRSGRPHIVTSAAVWNGATGELRDDYLMALWLLLCAVLAIDQRTVRRGAVGLVRDNAVELDAEDLRELGLTSGRRHGGYPGDFWVFARSLR